MKKTKVCCFCERWESGGIESFLNNVFHNIDLSIFQVDIVVAELSKSIFTEPLKQLGVNIYELSGSHKKLIENYRIFRKLLENGNYDIVHLNVFHALSLFYAKAARSAGVPKIIAHSHNTALRKSRTKMLKLCLHKLSLSCFSRYVTDFWACSYKAAEFIFPSNIVRNKQYFFVPNGIKTDDFIFDSVYREAFRQKLKLENTFVIGCIGRLCEQKNQLFLISVLKEALKIRDCRLLLVGEGSYEEILRKKAEEMQISDKIIFYGVSSEVNRLMCCMDCLAMPSLFEGLGIVAIEAQCLGLPVICSENIPEEAYASGGIKSIRLNEGAKQWAEALLDCEKTGINSKRNLSAVRASGFDVKNVSETIKNKYLEGTIHG